MPSADSSNTNHSSPLPEDSVFFIGLDVSSRDCFAALPGARRAVRFELSAAGASDLLALVRRHAPVRCRLRFVMEHTGVYSKAWAALLADAGAECALCNPARIRAHARGMGLRSKTDGEDAKAILDYAQSKRPEPTAQRSQSQAQLALLLRQRQAFTKISRMLKNQLHALSFLCGGSALIGPLISTVLAALDEATDLIDTQLQVLRDSDPEMKRAYTVACSVPGIGERTGTLLLTWLNEILDFTPSQLTALAGLAPAHNQSGQSQTRKSRIDKQGNAQLRQALYMASLSAARHCPPIHEFHQRLRAAGKPPKLVLAACSRKLLLLVQAVLKSGEIYSHTPRLT